MTNPLYSAYLKATLAVGLAVGLLLLAGSRINAGAATAVLLLAVLLVARFLGTPPAVLAACWATAAYTYFFFPPNGLGIEDPNDWIAFAVFIATAVVAGGLWGKAEHGRRQIEALYEELRASFERASEAEAARRNEQLKSALLDALRHNLRTPLTAIKAAVTALRGNEASNLTRDDQQELIEVINEESDHLNRLIGGLAGGDSPQDSLPGSTHPVSLEGIVRAALARAAVITSDHVVTTELRPDLPPVVVDPASVSEALYMVLDNASRYSPAGTAIRITARQAPDAQRVHLAVVDEGLGIPAEFRSRVFEEFFQVPGVKPEGRQAVGSGLGLSIARRLMVAQGGNIWIETAPAGSGTGVVFALPCAPLKDSADPLVEAGASRQSS